ncbi:MAG TPA: hypothetical protein VK190_02180 [Pseudoneobacillus sp.]|jgi:hypothetical protein|nr:hypothetical protein [Pseudoneobacillus sp.]
MFNTVLLIGSVVALIGFVLYERANKFLVQSLKNTIKEQNGVILSQQNLLYTIQKRSDKSE